MQHEPFFGERGWRAVALVLFIILVWQAGNAALSSPVRSFGSNDDAGPPVRLVPPAEQRPAAITAPPAEPGPATPPAPVVATPPAPVAPTAIVPPPAAPPASRGPNPVSETAPAAATAVPPVALPPLREPELFHGVVRVANTANQGVFIRATPRLNDRVRLWPEGTVMLLTGAEVEVEGRHWLQVRAPDGVVGWIPDQFLS